MRVRPVIERLPRYKNPQIWVRMRLGAANVTMRLRQEDIDVRRELRIDPMGIYRIYQQRTSGATEASKDILLRASDQGKSLQERVQIAGARSWQNWPGLKVTEVKPIRSVADIGYKMLLKMKGVNHQVVFVPIHGPMKDGMRRLYDEAIENGASESAMPQYIFPDIIPAINAESHLGISWLGVFHHDGLKLESGELIPSGEIKGLPQKVRDHMSSLVMKHERIERSGGRLMFADYDVAMLLEVPRT